MVGNDTVGSIHPIVVFGAELSLVRANARRLPNLLEEGSKEVGVVVGQLVLQDGDQALEA